MKPKKRQKLCFNCEGEIDLDVIVCPFCAADLREEKPEQARSRFNPPKDLSGSSKNQETMQSLYPPHYVSKPTEESEAASAPVQPMVQEEEKQKNIFAPTILLTLGVQLCVLGLLMLFFSHKGVLILKWNAGFWVLYLLASIPLFLFGYKSLSKL
jgi:hypothetical protein